MEKTRSSSSAVYSKCEGKINVNIKKINHSFIYYCLFLKMLNIFQKFVIEQNYSYLKLEGTTSIGSRQPIINKFNKVTNKVFLIFVCK